MTQVWLVLAAFFLYKLGDDVSSVGHQAHDGRWAFAGVTITGLAIVCFLLSFVLFFYDGGTTG